MEGPPVKNLENVNNEERPSEELIRAREVLIQKSEEFFISVQKIRREIDRGFEELRSKSPGFYEEFDKEWKQTRHQTLGEIDERYRQFENFKSGIDSLKTDEGLALQSEEVNNILSLVDTIEDSYREMTVNILRRGKVYEEFLYKKLKYVNEDGEKKLRNYRYNVEDFFIKIRQSCRNGLSQIEDIKYQIKKIQIELSGIQGEKSKDEVASPSLDQKKEEDAPKDTFVGTDKAPENFTENEIEDPPKENYPEEPKISDAIEVEVNPVERSATNDPVMDTVKTAEQSGNLDNLPASEPEIPPTTSLEPDLSIEEPAFYRKENQTTSLETDILIEDPAFYRELGKEKTVEEEEVTYKEKLSKIENFQIETIEDEEAKKILDKVEIHGDDFMGKFLSIEILKEEGLLPKHKIRIGDSVVWFSSSGYELDEGRVAIVAYVEKEGKLTACSYYRSNSQGVWRYLPDYLMSEGGIIEWYGKGHGEESITLPIVAQQALAEITREGMPILRLKQNPDFIFAGTAQKVGKKDGLYYREIEPTPKKLEGDFYAEQGKTSPDEIRLTEGQSPDFSKLLTSWEQGTSLYGQVIIEVFPSKDGKLKFMFCKDSIGRSWIGGIEDDSEIQTTGLKKSWIEGGDLATPAYEYKTGRTDQTGGYGNDKMEKYPYVDMYENYLKKIPVIHAYEASLAQRPERQSTEGEKSSPASLEPEKISLEKENTPETPSELDKLRGQITDIDKIIKEKRKSGVPSTYPDIVKLRKERAELSAKYWKDYLSSQKEKEEPSGEDKIDWHERTPEEKRERDKKEWEELTPDERKEKYEKSFELREKVWNLRQARENFVLAEAKAKAKGEKDPEILKKELEEAKQSYEKARAEYVGVKAWRAMKERTAKLEADVEKKSENKDAFEKLRKGWRRLGDLNISYFVEPKTKAGKIASRFFSARSSISWALFGASWATGFGSAAGMTALAARRVLSGVGAGFTSYDLMRNFSEKKDTTIGEKELDGLSIPRLEEKLARFEGWARITGDRRVLNKDYDRLRREIAKRTDEAVKNNPSFGSMTEKLLSLDEEAKKSGVVLKEEERLRRWKAAAVGSASLVAFSWLGSGPEGKVPTPSGASSGPAVEALSNGGKEVATGTAETVASEIPEKIITAAEAGPSGNQIIGTIEKGGNIWRAAKEMVKAGKITQAQFAEAWTNPNSAVKLAGEVHHISDTGLSHVGDQVIYIPGTEGAEGHFEVVDYARDVFHLGSNHELAHAFARVSKPLPNWLEKAQEVKESVSENIPLPTASSVSETLPAESSELASLEALSDYGHTPEINYLDFPNPDPESILPEMLPNALDPVVSESGEALSFSWGEASWIVNDLGHKYGLKFFDSPFTTSASRGKMVLGSIREYLLGDYKEAITEHASSFETADETIAKIARAKESAYNIKRLMDVCAALPRGERSPLRHFIGEIMKKVNKEAGVNVFKKIIIP